jgi:hypothetical protein
MEMTSGFGCNNFNFAVYIANKPNMREYQDITQVSPLNKGEIHAIGQACGNGWRKVFNVYAKLLYALNTKDFAYSSLAPSWQMYRDNYLFQTNSKTALLFSPPQLNENTDTLHIICGKTYAKQLIASDKLKTHLVWLDDEFAIDTSQKLIICPYFDYRHLSNVKIDKLAFMLSELKNA